VLRGRSASIDGAETNDASGNVTMNVEFDRGGLCLGTKEGLSDEEGFSDGGGAFDLGLNADWLDGAGSGPRAGNVNAVSRGVVINALNVGDVLGWVGLGIGGVGGEGDGCGIQRSHSGRSVTNNPEVVGGGWGEASDSDRGEEGVNLGWGCSRSSNSVEDSEAVEDSGRIVPAWADVDNVVLAEILEVDWARWLRSGCRRSVSDRVRVRGAARSSNGDGNGDRGRSASGDGLRVGGRNRVRIRVRS